MFRKGIVTFFDAGLGKGCIVLNPDQQQISFQQEDFSNVALLPQVGERVKCVVLEQHGELLAKFIVRLDYKNYTDDQKKRPVVVHSYEDSSAENLQTVRKMLRKRRLSIEQEYSEVSQQQQNQQNKQHDLTDVKDTIESVELSEAEFVVEVVEHVRYNALAEEIHLDDATHRIEQDNQQILSEELPLKQVEVDQKHENIVEIQYSESVKNHTDLVAEVPSNLSIEKVVQSTIHIQKEEHQDITDRIEQNDVEPLVRRRQAEIIPTEKLEKESDLPKPINIQEIEKQIDNTIAQQLLEKSMNLNSFQRLIHAIKVKFLYSKRKQVSQVKEEGKRIYLNPWIVIVGLVLVMFVGSGSYAFERYKQYKSASEVKLLEYEKQQKDVIKKQKQQAHAR